MYLDVLQRVAADTGYHITEQRPALDKLLAQAAGDLYRALECDAIYREVTLVVPADKIVSLPSYVGPLRGMRQHTTDVPFDLQSMATPRYVTQTWAYKSTNWRNLGTTPVHTLLSAVGTLNIKSSTAESVTVTIIGSGPNASRQSEDVVTTATTVVTTKQFGPDIYSIICRNARLYDIQITDVSDTEVAVLPNTQNQTKYQLVDVSQVAWSRDTTNGEALIDVLYKQPLPDMSLDTDQFPAGDDFDDAWYNQAMALYFTPLEGRGADVQKFLLLAELAANGAKGNAEEQSVKKLNFGRNKFYSRFRRAYGVTGNYAISDPAL